MTRVAIAGLGTIGRVRGAARDSPSRFQINGERDESEKLHEEESAVGADASRGEAGGKIRDAPTECAG